MNKQIAVSSDSRTATSLSSAIDSHGGLITGRNSSVVGLTVEFCGEKYEVEPGTSFSIGRDADLIVDDDNAYLHRKLVELTFDNGFWWAVNVGSRLSVTISGEAGTLQSWIGPGSRLPIVLTETAILFTAGETTYEVNVHCEQALFRHHADAESDLGDKTLGAVELTTSQFLLILALAEDTLRRAGTGSSALPSNVKAADRLGWSRTTFNRKLDNVCEKFSRAGVKGLRGSADQLAINRRARLVEYAVSARIVRPEHLGQLADQSGSDF